MAEGNRFGIKGIISNYDWSLLLKGAIWPTVLTSIVVLTYAFCGHMDIETISVVVDMIITMVPAFLGFVLSGYALMIGMSNLEIIAKRNIDEDGNLISGPTLYQKVSTVFAVGLIMQIILVVAAVVLKWILRLNLECWFENIIICQLINYITFGVLIFGLLYITMMIKDLIVNVFNFSQVQQFLIDSKAKGKKKKAEENGVNGNSSN